MASFLKKSREQISAAKRIGELKLEPPEDEHKEPFDYKTVSGRCWHVTYSPDETFFAWICSQRKVILVPWDGENNARYSSELVSYRNPQKRASVVIECGYPVLSVAIGSGHCENSLTTLKRKSYWTRFDFRKDIILATGHSNGRIRIWNVHSGKLLLELMDHKKAVRDLSFASDGSLRLVSASLDKTLKGWDLNDDGNMFRTFHAHKDAVLACCWSPNAALMASAGSQQAVFLWDMRKYEVLRKLEGHCNTVSSLTFSPDSAILATGSWDTKVILWDAYLGYPIRSLCHLNPPPNRIYAAGANSAWVKGVGFAKDGLSLVSISDDKFIRFWNLAGDVDPEGIAYEEEELLSCCYSPSGRSVAVGTGKFKVSFFSSTPAVPRLIHLARMAVRKCVHTSHIDSLEIPDSLKPFLKYHAW